MQARGLLVRSQIPHALQKAIAGLAHGSHLRVVGRDGSGSRTRVPWVRLFDPLHSPKATAGWYLVFLFAADGSACYLSLNQGTSRAGYGGTFRAKPIDEIAAATKAAQEALAASTLTSWSTELHLADPGAPGKAYEAGSVFCRRYDREVALTDEQIVAHISEGPGSASPSPDDVAEHNQSRPNRPDDSRRSFAGRRGRLHRLDAQEVRTHAGPNATRRRGRRTSPARGACRRDDCRAGTRTRSAFELR